jgi:hypothetical protein
MKPDGIGVLSSSKTAEFISNTKASFACSRAHPMTSIIEKYDGNKSLYLVFVGVVFLSILDCF